jgi:hypothetical protein
MSRRRMDISSPRKKKDGGTYWIKLGTAWFNDNGGIQLVFDALPIPDSEGRVVANLFEPRERTDAPRTNATQPARFDTDLDDSDMPF